MCIIAVKPKGVAVPTKEILKNMFDANPDGAGVAYNLNGKLYIVKGLMNFEDFYKVCQRISSGSSAIYHTRIQTSGGICKELTHPFLLDDDIQNQRKLFFKTTNGEAVAHNGVFSEFGQKELNSDTTQFISTYLFPLKKLKDASVGSILDDDIEEIINKLCGFSNKVAIIDQDGNLKRYGGSWILDNGIYYSNDTYKNSYSFEHLFKRPSFNNISCLSWKDKSTMSKAKNNIHNQVQKLREVDQDFEITYRKWHYFMDDEELLEGYENGWLI
jgi:predicted glutamine amidotransferase